MTHPIVYLAFSVIVLTVIAVYERKLAHLVYARDELLDELDLSAECNAMLCEEITRLRHPSTRKEGS